MGCGLIFSHQGIFPTEGLNQHLFSILHWPAGSLPLAPPGKQVYSSDLGNLLTDIEVILETQVLTTAKGHHPRVWVGRSQPHVAGIFRPRLDPPQQAACHLPNPPDLWTKRLSSACFPIWQALSENWERLSRGNDLIDPGNFC